MTDSSMQRGAFTGIPKPGPFHCIVCKVYVTGTESGHCPRCGFVPPVAPPARPPLETYSPLWLAVLAVIAAVVMLLLM